MVPLFDINVMPILVLWVQHLRQHDVHQFWQSCLDLATPWFVMNPHADLNLSSFYGFLFVHLTSGNVYMLHTRAHRHDIAADLLR